MAIPKKIINFLNKSKIKYQILKHKTVYTAYDKAQTLKVPEKIIGKTLVVKMNRDYAFVLIPANKILDKEKFKKVLEAKKIELATEKLIKNKIKGVKVGAVPPFGNLWGLSTFVDKSLFKNRKIIVNAGDYQYSIEITPNVFKKLTPDLITGNFSKKGK